MKVCIGITTFNRADILRKAIRSAIEQDYQPKEVFVIDDGSTDETTTLQAEFPEVRWCRFEESRGYRAARNLMMSDSDADLFCSLDDDSWFMHKDGLRQGVQLFETDPKLGAVGFEILDQGNPEGKFVISVHPANMFVGCGHLLRLPAVRQVGFYTDLPSRYGGEEKDLTLRLMDAGFEVVSLQGVHVWHDKTFVTRSVADQHFSGVGNDLWLTYSRSPLSILTWLLPLKILSHLRFAMAYGIQNIHSRSRFDRQIIADHSRAVFVWPTIRAVCRFVWHAVSRSGDRQPVSKATFREFLRRGRLA